MGSVGNQNPWTPYYTYKDCSIGICSIYCPQLCYFVFPPPPLPDDDSATPFSPLIIAIIGVLASAFILISYYTIVTRYCKRGNQNATEENGEEIVHDQWQQQQVGSTGLDEAIIKTITVCKYQRGQGLIEGTECAVCLSEFQENESLRLLPKCSHAFHLPCIDTWLKSHSNCPLCRANVAALAHPDAGRVGVDLYEIRRPDDLILTVNDQDQVECCEEVVVSVVVVDDDDDVHGSFTKVNVREDSGCDGESVGRFRRCVSLGAFPNHCRFNDEDLRVEKDQSVAMRRCNSTGRFVSIDHDKGKNRLLLH